MKSKIRGAASEAPLTTDSLLPVAHLLESLGRAYLLQSLRGYYLAVMPQILMGKIRFSALRIDLGSSVYSAVAA
jgi:hypothetical protein